MTSPFSRHHNRQLRNGLEQLEERWTPAQFGIPWNDPAHLTMSLAPDGTTAAGQASELFSALDAQMPRDTWQNVLRRAAQTWANVSNINVGLVSDQGQAFGTSGPTQGDKRFGDIRIGGLPMAATELAVSTPPATAVSGTFAGDIFINTAVAYTPLTLYSVALHEFGHAFGLDHSTDPASVMFPNLNGQRNLTTGDVSAIRGLYGLRGFDLNEDTRKPNDTLRDASRIKYSAASGGYDGSTPVVQYGDLANGTDVDIFVVKPLVGYTGAMTFRVQTSGISFLAPKITVMDRNGVVLATRQSTSNKGDALTIRLASVVPDREYFLKVEAAPTAAYRVGRFGVAVYFDGLLQPTAISIDSVLRGRYETLAPEKVDQLFQDPGSVLFEDDLHVDDTLAGAVNLRVGPGNPNPNALTTQATLSDATDVDYFRIRTPSAAGRTVVTLTLRAAGANGVVIKPELLDSNGLPVPGKIIANGNNTYTFQATGVAPNRNMFVRVAAPGRTGNYALDVQFGNIPAEVNTFLTGTVPSATTGLSGRLYIARTQLMNFVLDAASPGGLLTLTIRDSAGSIVQQLNVRAGNTISTISQILKPGEYSFTITASTRMAFTLRGSRVSDPIGPVLDDGTLEPQFQNPDGTFTFPDGVITSLPYLWLLSVL